MSKWRLMQYINRLLWTQYETCKSAVHPKVHLGPLLFAVRLVKHMCLTVVCLEKKKKKKDHGLTDWETLVKNDSDVFIKTSSILKMRIV